MRHRLLPLYLSALRCRALAMLALLATGAALAGLSRTILHPLPAPAWAAPLTGASVLLAALLAALALPRIWAQGGHAFLPATPVSLMLAKMRAGAQATADWLGPHAAPTQAALWALWESHDRLGLPAGTTVAIHIHQGGLYIKPISIPVPAAQCPRFHPLTHEAQAIMARAGALSGWRGLMTGVGRGHGIVLTQPPSAHALLAARRLGLLATPYEDRA